jgi:Peptidase family S41/N-terminal domain of Peptidase_S41 in eukaryotic IRBP
MNGRRMFAIVLVAALAFAAPAFAQISALERTQQKDFTIDAATRNATIDSLVAALAEHYVFPDIGKAMGKAVRARQKRGEYNHITSAAAFAESLQRHVQMVHNDLHLRIHHSFDPLPANLEHEGTRTPEQIAADRRFAQWANQGFMKVERMAGNLGYVDILLFFDGEEAYPTATAAMTFLANSDALIIDLRKCGGGSPDMVAYVTTYLFGEEPVHLNDLYMRETNTTGQHWTLPSVPGKRSTGKDVYVLTSSHTGSAAEEFAYNLKNLKRATIVGERTAGGANPGDMVRLGDHFAAFIANGRAINPITKTNWEGVGVEPDVAVSADEALRSAQVIALKKLLEKNNDAEERRKIQKALDEAQATAATPAATKPVASGTK